VPVARADWVNMLIRAEKQIERRHRGRLLLASSGRTRETLRQLQRELGDPEESPAELLQARDSLQTANRQLSEAMAELSLLYRFGRELSAASNWDEVLREILRSLTAFVGAGGAALVLPCDAGPADMAEAMARVLRDEGVRAEMRRRGRARVGTGARVSRRRTAAARAEGDRPRAARLADGHRPR